MSRPFQVPPAPQVPWLHFPKLCLFLLTISNPGPVLFSHLLLGPCSPEEQPRGWWFSEEEADVFSALEESTVCRGLQEALETVARALDTLGPFDGLLGFSQGAALAAYVCALGQAGDPRFPLPRFIILVSGFCPRGLKEPILQSPMSLPSLHVFGDTDRVIPSQESMQLASRFLGAVTSPTPVVTSFQQLHLSVRPTLSSWTSLQNEGWTNVSALLPLCPAALPCLLTMAS